MSEAINEAEIIEQLNSAPTVRGFFIHVANILNESIDGLIKRIFQKDNFAVQSVVGPLLHDSGPLGDLSVRLKLLFGLGVLSDAIYHDIDDLIKLKNKLNSDGQEYEFTDPIILETIKKLHLAKKMSMVPLQIAELDDDIDLEFYQLQLQRQQQIIKSGLSLAVVEICNELKKDSPF